MEAWYTHTSLLALASLLLAALADALWRWPRAYHPLTLFQLLSDGMARRVCPGAGHGKPQHYISGSLGAVVLLTPFAGLTTALLYMAQYPWFFESVLMLCLLDFGHDRYRYQQIIKATGQQKKILAREALGTLVARQTTSLSDIGIAKAAIESLLLRFVYLYCGVLVWFVLLGPVAALCYRLIIQINWQWNPRLTGYHWFGRPVALLANVLKLAGALPGIIVVMIATHPIAAFKGMLASPAKDRASLILAAFGAGLGIQLGGPAIYANQKVRFPRVGAQRQVRFSDMTYAARAISRARILLVTFLSLLLLLIWSVNLHA